MNDSVKPQPAAPAAPAALDAVAGVSEGSPQAHAARGGVDEQPPPETGDLVIDAALAELGAAASEDLDALITAGDRVQSTLQARLADLGG